MSCLSTAATATAAAAAANVNDIGGRDIVQATTGPGRISKARELPPRKDRKN